MSNKWIETRLKNLTEELGRPATMEDLKKAQAEAGRRGGQNGAGEEYRKGGSKAAGFAADPELARKSGAKGGRKSRRGKAKNV